MHGAVILLNEFLKLQRKHCILVGGKLPRSSWGGIAPILSLLSVGPNARIRRPSGEDDSPCKKSPAPSVPGLEVETTGTSTLHLTEPGSGFLAFVTIAMPYPRLQIRIGLSFGVEPFSGIRTHPAHFADRYPLPCHDRKASMTPALDSVDTPETSRLQAMVFRESTPWNKIHRLRLRPPRLSAGPWP